MQGSGRVLDKEQSLMLATDEELQDELERRQELREQRPQCIVDEDDGDAMEIFAEEVLKVVDTYCEWLEDGEHNPDLVWDGVMELAYGKDYHEYVSAHCD